MAPRPSSCVITLLAFLLAPVTPAIAAPEPAPVQAPIAPAAAAPEPETAPEVVIERVEVSGDEAILRDGSFVRGSILELAKGSHVTIAVGDETRRIAWEDLERVRLGTAPTAAAPAATETPVAETPATATPVSEEVSHPSGRRVYIDSITGRHLTLYRISGEFSGGGSAGSVSGVAYEPVCSGECGEWVDGSHGHEFFVGGEGITPSRRFTLDQDTGTVTLDVKAGSRAARLAGITLLSAVGVPFLVTGLVLLPFSSPSTEPRRVAVGLTLSGAMGMGIGIPLALVGRTIVEHRRGR